MEKSTSIFVANVAFKLKEKRLDRGQTLSDVSKATGMLIPAISRLEAGAQNMEADTLIPLLEYYGMAYNEVLCKYKTVPLHSDWQRLNERNKELTRSRRWKGKKPKRKKWLKDVDI